MAMLLPSRLLEVNSLFKVNFFTTLKTLSQPFIGLARPIMILYCQKTYRNSRVCYPLAGQYEFEDVGNGLKDAFKFIRI